MNDWERKVRDFHTKFNAGVGDPSAPRFKNVKLRRNLIEEECSEFYHAVDREKLHEAVHEAIDILYVTIGALVEWGITDIDEYFTAIHNANMNKTGGKIREDGKITKPNNWKPADIKELIQTQATRLNKKPCENEKNLLANMPVVSVPSEVITIEEQNVELSQEETQTGGKRGRPKRNNQ